MYRLLNVGGRTALERDSQWHDLASVGDDESLAEPMVAISRTKELHSLWARCSSQTASGSVAEMDLGSPVPEPRQVFGIGLNYRDHAEETGGPPPGAAHLHQVPELHRRADRRDPADRRVGRLGGRDRGGHRGRVLSVAPPEAWAAVAGLMLGQDISDR